MTIVCIPKAMFWAVIANAEPAQRPVAPPVHDALPGIDAAAGRVEAVVARRVRHPDHRHGGQPERHARCR